MKKITLLFAFSIMSLIGYAQNTNETTKIISESLERETEYIIVLDDVIVDGNIDMLLNSSHGNETLNFDFHAHEFAHDAAEPIDIESKFIEGAFSYNEYAVNYNSTYADELHLGS